MNAEHATPTEQPKSIRNKVTTYVGERFENVNPQLKPCIIDAVTKVFETPDDKLLELAYSPRKTKCQIW